MSEETFEDRQENELQVLKSIYNEALTDLRKPVWKVWKPLDLKITLTPQQGNSGIKEVFVKVDLHIICSTEYPKEIPDIILENSVGLSNDNLKQLKCDLEAKAVDLKGEVMIYELANDVEIFLHQHNKPGAKSFYEQMLLRQKEEEKEAKRKKDEAKQVILTEVAKRQEILMQEQKLRRESKKSSDNSDDTTRRSSTNRSNSSSYTEFDDDFVGLQEIDFDNNGALFIYRSKCLSHKENHASFTGLDLFGGDNVFITEWTIPAANGHEVNHLQRQINSIEQEFNYLVKLKHSNLVHYLNIKHSHSLTKQIFTLYVAQEFVYGCNCQSLFLYENISVDVDMLQHIAANVLSALDFLHRNNIVHKDLRSSSIFLDRKGCCRLSNYGIMKRIQDIIQAKPSGMATYGKKQDIFDFGMVVLSLIKGIEIHHENEIDIPQHISNNLYDFLNRCLCTDEKDRFTAIQLLNHPFLKVPVERPSPKHSVTAHDLDKRTTSPENLTIDLQMLINSNLPQQSRVQTEFEVLDCLGKGAYGEVFKVKNKLDQGYYAIKRIELNPKNKQLNKKIIREVKLLSKLNHENVVRYYNSWIECDVKDVSQTDNSSASSAVTNLPKVFQRKELTLKDNIEQLAPAIQQDWSYSKSKGGKELAEDSSEDESSDDEDDWGLMVNLDAKEDDSDSIEFVGGDEYEESDTSSSLKQSPAPGVTGNNRNTDTVDSVIKSGIEVQFMYIQMEFCEKSTLRTAIDNGLYKDTERTWRLFREIVEGLAHIHQQGMIHRDLKPVNIFLDSCDHVKIGDFGLATTNFRPRIGNEPFSTDKESSHDPIGDGSMTGHVGTALYVAPELCSSGRSVYDQKVDIYSLGIILFEMCYKPLDTGMERIKVLNALRTREMLFPKDFRERADERKEYVIRWLLNHNVTERPTSQEVLQSEQIPPPVLEECQLQELVRHTLSNPHLKGYKYLVESCFKQTTSPAQDITFDKDPSVPHTLKNVQIYDYLRSVMVKIFQLHGGQNLSTPLLMPQSKFDEKSDTCTKLMTHSGSIVVIPHDLRVPFARYVAWNGITMFRRYTIERVYREKKVFGFLPRELYECAFDIVTPTNENFMPDAELLFMLYEIIDRVPALRNKAFQLRVNHTLLIKSILMHCGVKDKHQDVCLVLSKFKEERITKFDPRNYFITLGLSNNAIESLISLLELELPIGKLVAHLQMITRKKTDTGMLAKTALQELRVIIQTAELLGVDIPIIVKPGIVSNAHHYSGMICELTVEVKKKNKGVISVIAAGGRYDGMIASYRNIIEQVDMLGKDVRQSAVGVSLSLDKMVQLVQKEHVRDNDLQFVDALICSADAKQTNKEVTKILKEFWEAGVRCRYVESSNMDVQEMCNDLHVPLIILKTLEPGMARLRCWENGRFDESKVKNNELVNIIKQKLKTNVDRSQTNDQFTNSVTNYGLHKSESKTCNDKCEHSHTSDINILIVTADDKLSSYTRKRYENQIKLQLEDFLKRLSGEIYILAINLERNIISKIAGYLEFETEAYFNKSLAVVLERHQKHKQYLSEICEEIYKIKVKRSLPIVILYSLGDSSYRII